MLPLTSYIVSVYVTRLRRQARAPFSSWDLFLVTPLCGYVYKVQFNYIKVMGWHTALEDINTSAPERTLTKTEWPHVRSQTGS